MPKKTIVAVYIVAILVVVAGVCALASGKLAVKPQPRPVINIELANKLVAWCKQDDREKAYLWMQKTLDQLNPDEFKKLYRIIDDDHKKKRDIIVSANPLPPCSPQLILATIQDRLGTLEFDRISEGEFGLYDWWGKKPSRGLYYQFSPLSGDPIRVYVARWTVSDSWQLYHSLEKKGDVVRIFIQEKTLPDGSPFLFVCKIETI